MSDRDIETIAWIAENAIVVTEVELHKIPLEVQVKMNHIHAGDRCVKTRTGLFCQTGQALSSVVD